MGSKEYHKEYRKKNKEKMSKQKKEWYSNNKESILESRKQYYIDNKEKIKEYNKKNEERIREYNKEYRKQCRKTDEYIEARKQWRENNKEKIREHQKKYTKKNKEKLNEYMGEYNKNRKDTDPVFKLSCSMRTYIGHSIRNKGYTKKSKSYIILGCTYEEFKNHIESQWEDWMEWNNYGKYNCEENYGWDIDHIIPMSSAQCEDDVIRLNHHTNIQPLCSYINRCVKRDNVDYYENLKG